jgi:hypothetical protein
MSSAFDLLAGKYWYYNNSTYGGDSSSDKTFNLNHDGSFYWSREEYMSSDYNSSSFFSNQSNSGVWTADGDQFQGTVLLKFSNGDHESLTYVVSPDPKDRGAAGPAVYFAGEKYQRTA